jgi:uncharacterized repeat protein (TIGR03803 family)
VLLFSICAFAQPGFSAAPVYEELFARFGARDTGYSYPAHGRLVQAADGNFYGSTTQDGVGGGGTAFRVTPDGELTVIHAFESAHTFEGYSPSPLTLGSDGNLYGISQRDSGAFFKMTLEGVVTPFRAPFDGFGEAELHAPLKQAADGTFYGVSYTLASPAPEGVVFRINQNGQMIFAVPFNNTNGAKPDAALVEGDNGSFYGTTSEGGANGHGTIFRITPDGGLTSLFSFGGVNGSTPQSALVKAPDGHYYGTTTRGGTNNLGTVYRFTPGSGVTTLVSFDGSNGSLPVGGVTLGTDGNLYGTASGGVDDAGIFYQVTLQGQLTAYAGFNEAVGVLPDAGVTLGSDGRFYGWTPFGGEHGGGTVFRATRGGSVARLVSFGPADGLKAVNGVIQASDGAFYGSLRIGRYGVAGGIFKVTPQGEVSTVASLLEEQTGAGVTRVVQAPDGYLYGATSYNGFQSGGTVFRVSLQGQLTVLASLTAAVGKRAEDFLLGSDGNCYGLAGEGGNNNSGTIFRVTADGAVSLTASLNVAPSPGGHFNFTRDTDGSFYGTASAASSAPSGLAFRVTPAGAVTKFPFSDISIGSAPSGGVTKGADGNFYGSTSGGGEFGDGAVFKLTPAGQLTRVASFNHPNAGSPVSGLVLAEDGSFYGTTFGPQNVTPGGTVFNVTPSGALAIVAAFGKTGGDAAEGPLLRAADGYYYGTTARGGLGGGVVFRFTSSPPELQAAAPSGGLAGDPIVLSGKFLAGTSSVKFNGVSAPFKITDSTHITAVVPAGATSGAIEITNPLGTATLPSFSMPPADGDGDGMPDEFELQYFGNATGGDPLADTDRDGRNNLEEYRARTNPNDAQSVLRVREMRREQTDVVLVFPAAAYRSYRVEASDNLQDGFPILVATVPASASDREREVIDFDGALHARRFYRVTVVPPVGAPGAAAR